MHPPPPEMTCGFLIQLVFCKKTMWFIGVEVEQETSAPPPEKNPGSAPVTLISTMEFFNSSTFPFCSTSRCRMLRMTGVKCLVKEGLPLCRFLATPPLT